MGKEYSDQDGRRVMAVRDLNLDIYPGEVAILVGESGSGKTSILRCLAGLERPDHGTIEIDGTVVADAASKRFVAPEDRDIGMVFQSYAIWPHMTVLQNIVFPLRRGRTRLSKAAALACAHEALQLVQMDEYAERFANQLSGGQQQRVAVARALALEPGVILMDEPLSNLDAALRGEMRSELASLFARLKVTVVYVTHDHVEAFSLGTRVIILDSGMVVQEGTPQTIHDRPVSSRVMRFLGGWNVFDVLGIADGRIATAVGRFAGPTDQPRDDDKLAIRTRDVELLSDETQLNGREPAANVVSGIVVKRTFLGDSLIVEVNVGGSPIKVSTLDHGVSLNSEVRLHLPAGAFRWISGRRIPESAQISPAPDSALHAGAAAR